MAAIWQPVLQGDGKVDVDVGSAAVVLMVATAPAIGEDFPLQAAEPAKAKTKVAPAYRTDNEASVSRAAVTDAKHWATESPQFVFRQTLPKRQKSAGESSLELLAYARKTCVR